MLTLKPPPLPSPAKKKWSCCRPLRGPFADALPAWLHSYRTRRLVVDGGTLRPAQIVILKKANGLSA